jgi:hypothetical protein
MYFSVSRTAAILGFSETAIFRLAESGEIHSLENAAGSLLICGNSLLAVNDEISQRATTINRTKLETNKEH